MSFARSTASSRNRARTPVGTLADTIGAMSGGGPMAVSGVSGYRSRVEGRVDRKRQRDGFADELRRSQQLTADCGEAVAHTRQVLQRAEERSQRLSQTLRESLERSPVRLSRGHTPVAVNTPMSAKTPSQRAERRSLPSGARAPPPTPSQNVENESGNANSGGGVSWVSRLLSRSPAKIANSPVPSPPPPVIAAGSTPTRRSNNNNNNNNYYHKTTDDKENKAHRHLSQEMRNEQTPSAEDRSLLDRVRCSLQRLSGRTPSPPPGESPRRSRKSVVFDGAIDNGKTAAVTPFRNVQSEITGRGSVQYPPAPPPSAAKLSPHRTRGASAERISLERISPNKMNFAKAEPKQSAAVKAIINGRYQTAEEFTEETSTDETDETEEETDGDGGRQDVAAIIRDMPRSRAFRLLTKRNLVVYAKEHHIVLSIKSPKRELFEVARRLATSGAA